MKNILFYVLVCFCPAWLSAQFSEPSWMYIVDAHNDADISDVEVDNDGNTYITANYMGTLTLEGNHGEQLPVSPHVFGVLIKLDKMGKLVWCRGFKSAMMNRINDMALGDDGSIYISGFGDGRMHFKGISEDKIVGRDKAPDEYNQPQGIYVAKYSKDGECVWTNFWSTSWGEGRSVAVNHKGEVVWSYYHHSDLMHEGKLIDSFTHTEKEQAKVSFAYFNSDGTLNRIQPFQILPSSSSVRTPNFKFDQKDQLYAYGMFTADVRFTPEMNLTSDVKFESLDSYVVKYDVKGKYIWSRQFGGQNAQVVNDLDFGEDGSIYGTGEYRYECVLMDGIQAAQKSKYEYKSGTSMFYFHLFENGETDFIRFQEGQGYIGDFIAESIDYDVNGDIHIVGSFKDTLQLDDFTLNETPQEMRAYTSTWSADKPTQLEEIGTMKTSWILGRKVRSSGSAYAIGAVYYGDDITMKIGGENKRTTNFEYGRGSIVYGGSVKRKQQEHSTPGEMIAYKRQERLEGIEALLQCSNPEMSEATTTWFPITEGNGEDENVGVNLTPCGMTIEELEASLYPNPTEGPVSIKLKGMKEGTTQVDVYSEQGQLLYSQRLQIQTQEYIVELDLTGASTGTYFVRIHYKDFEKALRLVKVKR